MQKVLYIYIYKLYSRHGYVNGITICSGRCVQG